MQRMRETDTHVYLSWDYVFERLETIDLDGQRVYGVPMGGLAAAAFLRKAHVVHDAIAADIILDDIVDSGRTREKYAASYPSIPFSHIYQKPDGDLRWGVFPWEEQHPNKTDDGRDIVLRMLQRIGEDTRRVGLNDTPARVVRSWAELFKGYTIKPESIVTLFDEGTSFDEIVILRDIEMYSTCEHHMLPFIGRAHIAYLPGGKLLGISKLARLLEVYSRRLQIQERIGQQVTEFLMEKVGAKGAACIIEASHLCMQMRGVSKQHSVMVTSSVRGVFRDSPPARAELMGLIGRGA
jgi:GTP cyclohydrolase I